MDRELLTDEEFLSCLEEWWRALDRNRGDRAVLRRAETPDDIFFCPVFQRGLLAVLAGKGRVFFHKDQYALALVAGLLAHVRSLHREEGAFPALLRAANGDSPQAGDIRFQQLMASDDIQERYGMARRLLALLDGVASLRSLLELGCFWNGRTKRNWAITYYQN